MDMDKVDFDIIDIPDCELLVDNGEIVEKGGVIAVSIWGGNLIAEERVRVLMIAEGKLHIMSV